MPGPQAAAGIRTERIVDGPKAILFSVACGGLGVGREADVSQGAGGRSPPKIFFG